MKLTDFDYPLPTELIAQEPPEQRSGGRLLVLDAKTPQHRMVTDLPALLRAGDLLVMNDTRVYPARLSGRKQTGGKVEIFVERIIDAHTALCLCRASKSPRPGTRVELPRGGTATVLGREDDFYKVTFEVNGPLLDYLEQAGELPLPPYIERAVEAADKQRYQTVFASKVGAVAAPTAGLHFDDALLSACQQASITRDFLTLHVGAGTFQPVREAHVHNHKLHSEHLAVSDALCERIHATKAAGGRVIAVGTTVVRALETAAQSGVLQSYEGDTRLFLKPGDKFNVIDGLITNFHLPKSTLLMLVCAFAGYDRVMSAYREAVEKSYRFFSYGDAMLVFPEAAGECES
jgi:S-adenosylmethionine:tRNA ribosyltransferase-isomerase